MKLIIKNVLIIFNIIEFNGIHLLAITSYLNITQPGFDPDSAFSLPVYNACYACYDLMSRRRGRLHSRSI